jgi:hypothetical protein
MSDMFLKRNMNIYLTTWPVSLLDMLILCKLSVSQDKLRNHDLLKALKARRCGTHRFTGSSHAFSLRALHYRHSQLIHRALWLKMGERKPVRGGLDASFPQATA